MQGVSSQSASNNLQLCYQKYLLSVMLLALKQSSSLETHKQNYIIIFTSLLGSFIDNHSQ